MSKPTSIPSNKTVLEGTAQDMLYFNLKATAEDQILKGVAVTGSAVFSGFADSVSLMQGTTVLQTLSDDDDLSGKVVYFDDISKTLTKDATVPFTVRVTLKDGEVTNLGTSVTMTLLTGNVDVVRSKDVNDDTITLSNNLVGNTYQISSTVPAIALTAQSENNTTIQFGNASEYDIQFISGTVKMLRNREGGDYIAREGTGNLRETVNGTIINVGGYVPGEITFNFTGLPQLGSDTMDRIIELYDPAHTIIDTDYTVTVTSVTYKYIDRDDLTESAAITETYNVSK